MTAEEVISKLKLSPLPEEGGYYRRTYASEQTFPAHLFKTSFLGTRHFSTAIYYLITPSQFSALHRLPQDEILHFYSGEPVEMLCIDTDEKISTIILGSDINKDQRPQVIVPQGVWQGTRLLKEEGWALLGATVSPGFEFSDLEVAGNDLLERFPNEREKIKHFIR